MNWECLWPTAIWEWQRVLNIRYPKFAASSFSCSTAMSRYPPDLQTLAHGSTSQCIPMKHCHNHNIPPRHFYHHSYLFSQMPKKNPLVIMAMALEYQCVFMGAFLARHFWPPVGWNSMIIPSSTQYYMKISHCDIPISPENLGVQFGQIFVGYTSNQFTVASYPILWRSLSHSYHLVI